MTASGKALWDSLSLEMKNSLATLATAWHSRRAKRIEDGSPASSLEVSDDEDDTTMQTGPDGSAPSPTHIVHVGFTMEQAQAHLNTAMAEVQPAPASLLAF